MTCLIHATVSGGLLRPDHPLSLPEGSRVELTIRSAADAVPHAAALADFDQVCSEIVIPPEAHRMTREEMYRSRTR